MDIWGEGGHYEIGQFLFYYFIIIIIFFFGGGGGFLNILGLFKVKIQNGIFFLESKISKHFWVCLTFLIFFFFLGGGVKQ